MSTSSERLIETVTLQQAKALLHCAAHEQSFLLLSPPGVGKSDMVLQTAAEAGLTCRSLLGTQIAPEDVSGVPMIAGERSVFCPPRVLLPEPAEPFCLFLDELPASAPDIQKAFYSLLLERRLGEHKLPAGTWVVAAGNRTEDRSLVRTISSALVNRVIVLQVRVDTDEWLAWAEGHAVRREVIEYVRSEPAALLRAVPMNPVPFSTPRAWASLSRALDLAEMRGALHPETLHALVAGRVSSEDVQPFCDWFELIVRGDHEIRRLGRTRTLQMPVSELDLSQRAVEALLHADLATVGALCSLSSEQLLNVLYRDTLRLQEIEAALASKGLQLRRCLRRSDGSVTLKQARELVEAVAADQSVLLLSPPGLGKSHTVQQAAANAGLPCKSLLGTQIAPEDVSGIPRIVGERSVFCPPRVLLPESNEPFCLFLDELPACAPDVQKAFYSLLLERRVGEFPLPDGTWVVAAGNRTEDRALVRAMSLALVNRVFLINVRGDVKEWLIWAKANGIRSEVLAFITYVPASLMRSVPREPAPFSTPRAWASLSRLLDLAEQRGSLTAANRRALAFGTISAEDAALFCAMAEESLADLLPIEEYFADPTRLPEADTARWFIISRIRYLVTKNELPPTPPEQVNHFLTELPNEFRFALLIDLVEPWSTLGATDAMFAALKEVTGL